jgi:hypothetical protein
MKRFTLPTKQEVKYILWMHQRIIVLFTIIAKLRTRIFFENIIRA